MSKFSAEVLELLPQKPPFLFVDKVIERGEGVITTSLTLTGEEDFFMGHFPGNPIMPGVLLQEASFQSGALLMASLSGKGLGVVTKVSNAKFKNFVKPGDELIMQVSLVDQVSNAYYMKAKSTVNGKVVMAIEFSCALIEE
ncbi:(3R)-hydroxymyristol acyl carrier protein dehydrase [Halobacteriovorax marinus SJ]|uniref:(3R)-hydroxymyristol acyl carrier protein dehydrase n=1 Tax=Halobacteriovorax marinus (strain ATCC BAA-682 / DSM 15412 / SJ) TaxID=862908 RepID=E1X068_HALMS|nr:3-hydroxyacyl-ACP dehydratase FabZ family protein [Halobacteriovorax marinus]CBW26295.1 (3R)-hydroxymyristol acyl carrier protein dehydrase [Halobacteriovorax marinus SJ]